MRLFIFRSQKRPDLRAFTGDDTGSKLPEKHGPWDATGVVRADKDPPHGFPRAAIEASIAARGFQLWQLNRSK